MVKYCSKCGAQNDDDTVYCVSCGNSLTGNVPITVEKSRTLELVLGILGGVFGLLGALFAIFFSAWGGTSIFMLGVSAFLASIVGIGGAIYVKSHAQNGGIILIVAAIWLLISISLFGSIGFIFFLIAGICAIFRK